MGYENFTDSDSIIINKLLLTLLHLITYIANSLNLTAYRKCHTSKVLLAYWNKPKVGIKLYKLSNSILNTALVSFLFTAVVNPYLSFKFKFF